MWVGLLKLLYYYQVVNYMLYSGNYYMELYTYLDVEEVSHSHRAGRP